MLAKELRGGEIICLTGELGSGKTTFAQGLLAGLGAVGPYTSPTFVVIKRYSGEISNFKLQISNKIQSSKFKTQNERDKVRDIYHIDAYRVGAKDILGLGWEEMVSNKNNIVIVEWAEKIRRAIPREAIWIEFKHLGSNKREIKLKTQNSNVKTTAEN